MSIETYCPGRTPHKRGQRNNSILNQINESEYAEDVKAIACDIVQCMYPLNAREKRKLQQVIFVLYQAHKEKGIPFDPFVAGKKMGLEPRFVKKMYAEFSPENSGLHFVNRVVAPSFILKCIIREIDMDDLSKKMCIEECIQFQRQHAHVFNCNPKAIASGFLKFFLESRGKEMTGEEYESCVGVSINTIEAAYKTVILALSS